MGGVPKEGVFAQCSFAIVRGPELDDATALELANLMRLHNGEAIIDQYPETPLSLRGITHIISHTSDFPDYDAACDGMIPVVKPIWAQHCLAKNKLANPRQYNPDPKLFMSDVVACCADLPEGDADAITGGILAMGGLFSSKLTNQVTHIVALSTEADLCDLALRKNLNIKIVLPHWFDDCLKLGRKIDEHPYLLPDPELLRPPQDKAPAAIQKASVTGALDPHPASTPPPSPSSIRTQQKVFKNKLVMLGKDLGIGSHLRRILETIITNSGGKITNTVKRADIFICKYRDGNDYLVASRAGKHVGNLGWLYYLITTDAWTSPLRRLLHYPMSREAIKGFADLKISLSNYSGEARTYLENLIIAAGGECTKTLKENNTHLVTAHVLSEKCAAAKDWGIIVVNHLWLEESYALWKMQSVVNSRYTHFPSRTNLGEVVGQTPIDRQVIDEQFLIAEDVDMTDAGEEPEATNSNAPSRPPKDGAQTNGVSIHRTPAMKKIVPVGKENVTPGSAGSRKSKDIAAAKLSELTPDIALYEKEKKRAGGVVYGGRRKGDEDRVVTTRKRSVSEATSSDDMEENEVKKQRRGLPPPAMHLMISGYKKWTGHPKVEDSDKKQLRSLGILVTQDPARATHLAAPHILRTQKFVAAMAYAPAVLSTNFIDACLEHNEFVDESKFVLVDKAHEKSLGFSLSLSRERAKENRNLLLQGISIHCVENIHGGFDIYKSIIEANGGQCMLWRNRKGNLVPSRRAESEMTTEDEMNADVFLLSDPDRDNEKMWHRFRQMAEGSRKTPRIVIADWLLETAMCQKLLPSSKYEIQDTT